MITILRNNDYVMLSSKHETLLYFIFQCLQQQYDIICDKYDVKCNEIKELTKKYKKEEDQLLEQTKLCSDIKSDVETLKSDLACAQKTILR